MDGIHDVRTSGLSQVVELAKHRPIVEVEIKNRFFLESMQTKWDLGWNRFGVGILDPNVINDRIITELFVVGDDDDDEDDDDDDDDEDDEEEDVGDLEQFGI